MRGLIISGTDTGVGKTYVGCRIATALRESGVRVGAYKPVCSGAGELQSVPLRWDDIEALWTATGALYPRERIGPQCFAAPVAPPVAARLEGRAVDPELLRTGIDWWRERVDILLIEGAGGWLSPMSERESFADLAADVCCPVLIVAADRLGMINHTLLTIESIQARGLPVAGIVINHLHRDADASAATNAVELERRTSVPILADVEFGGDAVLRPGSPAARMGWSGLAGPDRRRSSARGDF